MVERVEEETALTGEEFRHARVLRVKEGEEVTLIDGAARTFRAIVTKLEKDCVRLHVIGEETSNAEPMSEICLAIGYLKGDKTELVVQKAAELGASRVVVFSSDYSSAYMNDNKLARLERVAKEAAKQCRRASVPAVEYYPTLGGALRAMEGYDSKYFACEFLEEGALGAAEGSCALVVGSEGGFSREEYELAQSYGFCGVTLGRRILRAETAAIALLSVVAYLKGELR